MMTPAEVRKYVTEALFAFADEGGNGGDVEVVGVTSFEELEMMTRDEGVLVTFTDGTVAQMTIVRR